MATVFGRARTENHTLASGKTRRRKAMACMFGEMVISTKESGKAASGTGTVATSSPMEMSSSANIRLASLKDLVSTNG